MYDFHINRILLLKNLQYVLECVDVKDFDKMEVSTFFEHSTNTFQNTSSFQHF